MVKTDGGRVGEVSQDALAAGEAVDAGAGEEVNSGDGGCGSDKAGVNGVGGMFPASRGPLANVNSKLVSLDWSCIARRCFGRR